ncbi:MAG: universal stress protein [Nodosilinea sp.]
MFKKILVALDNSPQRQFVLEKAIDIARDTQAELKLCHVLSAHEEGSPGIPIRSYQAYYPVLEDSTWRLYQERWEDFETQGIAQLQEETDVAIAAGVTTSFTQVAGDPAPTLCRVAGSWQADLIVVGSHGRRGISELLMGSVSNYVTHHAECSVLIVQHAHGTATASASAAVSATA